MSILEKSKAELSLKTAYPIIKVSNKCGYWRAYYQFKNSDNVTQKVFEDRSHNYCFTPFENAKRAAELCAVIHVSNTSEIIASGFDVDNYYFIVG